MKIARVLVEDSIHLARVEDGGNAILLHPESTHPAADALREALALDVSLEADGPAVPPANYQLLSPVRNPSKYFGIGMNYREHALEGGHKVPDKPIFFIKTPNTIIGPGEDIRVREATTQQPDFEVELVVVIGLRITGDDPPSAAGRSILGYTVGNDVTARDAQFSDGQWPRASLTTVSGPWAHGS